MGEEFTFEKSEEMMREYNQFVEAQNAQRKKEEEELEKLLQSSGFLCDFPCNKEVEVEVEKARQQGVPEQKIQAVLVIARAHNRPNVEKFYEDLEELEKRSQPND